jgi:Tol biopolymer transport system component
VLAYLGVESQDRVRLEFVDRTGKPVRTVGEPGVYNDVRLSHDDQRVAFVRPDPQGTGQIWTLDTRSGTPTPLTTGPTFEATPIWSGDTRIVFARNGGLGAGTGGLSQIDINSADSLQSVAVESPGGKMPYDASRDGRFLLYGLSANQRGFNLWTLPIGGQAFQVSGVPADQREAQLSPDGRWLAYVSDQSGSSRVYVRRFSGAPADAGTEYSVAIGQQPKWGRDGSELFYVAGGNMMAVDIQRNGSLGAGQPKALFPLGADALGPGGVPRGYSVTSDGLRFLISRTTKEAVPAPLTVILNWSAGLKG